jgi:hypothetical protein
VRTVTRSDGTFGRYPGRGWTVGFSSLVRVLIA